MQIHFTVKLLTRRAQALALLGQPAAGAADARLATQLLPALRTEAAAHDAQLARIAADLAPADSADAASTAAATPTSALVTPATAAAAAATAVVAVTPTTAAASASAAASAAAASVAAVAAPRVTAAAAEAEAAAVLRLSADLTRRGALLSRCAPAADAAVAAAAAVARMLRRALAQSGTLGARALGATVRVRAPLRWLQSAGLIPAATVSTGNGDAQEPEVADGGDDCDDDDFRIDVGALCASAAVLCPSSAPLTARLTCGTATANARVTASADVAFTRLVAWALRALSVVLTVTPAHARALSQRATLLHTVGAAAAAAAAGKQPAQRAALTKLYV